MSDGWLWVVEGKLAVEACAAQDARRDGPHDCTARLTATPATLAPNPDCNRRGVLRSHGRATDSRNRS